MNGDASASVPLEKVEDHVLQDISGGNQVYTPIAPRTDSARYHGQAQNQILLYAFD